MDNLTHSYTTKTDRKEPVPYEYRELLQIRKKIIRNRQLYKDSEITYRA